MIGRLRRSDLVISLLFLLLPILLFWSVIFGGKVLLPLDNLFTFAPWQAFSSSFGIAVPHNQLLSDLILENYAWKHFIVENLKARQIPLWNPYLFAGVPFLAAGQHSALYPLSLLFYLLPMAKAYGYFTVLQLTLAGLFMYLYGRLIGLGRLGAVIAGLTYMFSGFLVVSVVFPMVIAAAAWLPLLLAVVELVLRESQPEEGHRSGTIVLYVSLGAVVLGIQFLAGHVEIAYYNLLVLAFYALCRLGNDWRRDRDWRQVGRVIVALGGMVIGGIALGAVQLVPLYELVRLNFRQGSAGYQEVIGWAYPLRQIVTFFIPDFFGNPAHHGYFDLLNRAWQPLTHNYAGQPVGDTWWGIKNYVEAGSYVGLLPLLLAVVAVLGRRTRYVWLFASLALFSLLFTFGTPFYAILYYFLPGYRQLHTPFRWVYPYTLSISLLAGLGAEWLARYAGPVTSKGRVLESKGQGPVDVRNLASFLGWGAFLLGTGVLSVLMVVFLWPAPFVTLADTFLKGSEMAQRAFPSGRAFLSYQWPNFLMFGLFLLASGAVVRISRCPIYLPRVGYAVWKPLAVVVLALDLFLFAYGFNPAADPRLLEFTPPSVEFLQRDKELYRITTYNALGEKTFNANVGMFYGIADLRGYDSIIPKQYAEFMNLIEGQGELIYNRIAPFYWHGSLDSRLLDLANVKYVLTTQEVPNDNYTLVYDEEIRIYRNDDYLPRAFVVPTAKVIKNDDLRSRELRSFDPSAYVILEEEPRLSPELESEFARAASRQGSGSSSVVIADYRSNEVVIEADLSEPGWLVLDDSYFPGWQAHVRSGEGPESPVKIYKADHNFRAVPLGAGKHVLRFKYSPMSFKIGLYATFIAGVAVVMAVGYWLWGRLYREEEDDRAVRRVAKNSLIPMATSLVNKAIDTVFAMLMLRVLGPEGAGKYAFAIVVVGYFEIFTNFGLNTLLTREVAKDRGQANRYLSNTTIMRLILCLAVAPILALFILTWPRFSTLPNDTVMAVLLLALGLIPGGVSAALSSVFTAHEKMEYPAAITTVTTLVKVTLGAIVLLSGFGFVGLAAVSFVANVATMLILFYLVVKQFFLPRLEVDLAFGRSMLGISYPLMINHLLATIFFRVDVTLLQPMKGDVVVGWYTTAYKFIDGLNIVPSTFTIAIFPLMSRYAATARDSLMRAYVVSIKFLLIVAMPVVLFTVFYAEPIILIFGGSQYLPQSAIALQLLIWFLPFSFINSVTQYVLIAIDQQRFLTKAFLIGVTFNVVANLIFIPIFSYRAAAVITIFSELALFLPFYYCMRKHLASVQWFALAWRPFVAALLMGLIIWWTRSASFLLVIPLALAVYATALVALGTFDEDERAVLRELIPRMTLPLPLRQVTSR